MIQGFTQQHLWHITLLAGIEMDEQKQDDQLCVDTWCNPEDLPEAMDDREG